MLETQVKERLLVLFRK